MQHNHKIYMNLANQHKKYFQKIKKCNIIQKSKNILLHSIEFKIFTIQNRVIKLKSTIHFKM